VIAALVALAAAVAAQGAAAQADQSQIATSRIMLAAVEDMRGGPVIDVDPDDFVITENGREQELLSVYPADYPIVVLLDNTSSAPADLEAMRGAVVRFISRLGPRAVAIGTLTRPPAFIASFEDERAAALDKLGKEPSRAGAPLAPIEAVSNAVTLIRETGTPFSAIVVVTARPVEAEPEAPGLPGSIFESRAFVHVVTKQTNASAPAGSAGLAGRAPDLLRDLADQSRGQYTAVFSAASYSIALDRLIERLSGEVMIEYLVGPDSAGTGDVRVGVKIPGARVRGLAVSR
jgi:hypothetical protein